MYVCVYVANGNLYRNDTTQYKVQYVLCLTHTQDETDEQYLRKVADVMHSLFRTHGSTLLPLFDQLLPTFAGMLVSCHAQTQTLASFPDPDSDLDVGLISNPDSSHFQTQTLISFPVQTLILFPDPDSDLIHSPDLGLIPRRRLWSHSQKN